MSDDVRALLEARIRDVPDFPKPGIVFKDITPLLGDGEAFSAAIDQIAGRYREAGVDKVVGIEARGFIIAAPVADRLGAGFVPMRKRGKLPWRTLGVDYELEYGTERLELHDDAVSAGDQVLIVDDVLATGGTARAACDIVAELGAEVVGVGVVIELAFLPGRERLGDVEVSTILVYD